MLIALYQDHHELPWWNGKKNPFAVFEPSRHGGLPVRIHSEIQRFESVKYIFSFLLGLHKVEAEGLMAHVSALCSCGLAKDGSWHPSKRIWVQISNQPEEFTSEGCPVVYDLTGRLKPELRQVWGGDNKTYTPIEFITDLPLRHEFIQNPDLWTRFFIEQLGLDPKLETARANVRAAQELLKEAQRELDYLQLFGPNKVKRT